MSIDPMLSCLTVQDPRCRLAAAMLMAIRQAWTASLRRSVSLSGSSV